MYLGRIVEIGDTEVVWASPRHPYTEALVAAIPRADGAGVLPADLPGDVPDPAHPPAGCRFHPRCPLAQDSCRELDQRLSRWPTARSPATYGLDPQRPPRPARRASTDREEQALAWFVNAHVVDVLTGERLRGRAVEAAADGTVAQVAAAAPPGLAGADVVDVAGRWLLPGLITCHTHLSIVFPFSATDEAEHPALTAYRSATRAGQALRAGITTIRCVHEQNRADLLLRTAVQRGWAAAPRILGAAGPSRPGAATARAVPARMPQASRSSTKRRGPNSRRAPTT
jgi:oligopeptide/dipeptide ABC transporter ATP-binding protein